MYKIIMEKNMKIVNLWGLLFVGILLIPNILFALRHREGFENAWHNRLVETLEQIGRFGCFIFMWLQVPGTCFGWPSDEAFALYLVLDAVLLLAYCVIWGICFNKSSLFRALALSILPSLLFLASGFLSRSILLILAALVFAPCHILLSYKNAKQV